MTPENVKALLPVLTAFAEGKRIEVWSELDKKWEPLTDNPYFNLEAARYRIKPEPRYIFINEYEPGHFGQVHSTSEEAKRAAGTAPVRTVVFVEVI